MKHSVLIEEISRLNPVRIDDETEVDLAPDARDLLRTILATPRHSGELSPVRSQHLASRSRRVIVAATATGVAASSLTLAGAFSSTPTVVHHSTLARQSAVAFLDSATTAAAARQTLPALTTGEYYYEKNVVYSMSSCELTTNGAGNPILEPENEPSGTVFNYQQPMFREEWATTDGAGAVDVTQDGAGQILPSEQTAWESAGSPGGCNGIGRGGMTDAGLIGWIPIPGYQNANVGALPTDPSTLGSLLATGRINDIGQIDATSICNPVGGGGQSVVPPGATCPVSTQFDIASNLLVAPEGPERVGPALYQLLSQLPGVENIGTQTDAFGRTGTAIEDPNSGDVFVIDPTTGTLLEEENIEIHTTHALFPLGAVTYAVSFGAASIVEALGARPGTNNSGASSASGATGSSAAATSPGAAGNSGAAGDSGRA